MNTLTRSFGVAIAFAMCSMACKKTPVMQPQPVPVPVAPMNYIDLKDRIVAYQRPAAVLDLNNDGRVDLFFEVQLVGDPILQVDKMQFMVTSDIGTGLAVNSNEEIPVLNKNEEITIGNIPGFTWYGLSSVVLVQRIENIRGERTWDGHWKHAVKRYLPFQVAHQNGRYNGWVELSVDIPNERVVLHRAAISKQPDMLVKAGL